MISATDVYLPEGEPGRALVYPGPRSAAEPQLLCLVERLAARAAEHRENAFTVQVRVDGEDTGEALFRAQRADTVSGRVLVFRRLARIPPDLQALLPKTIVDVLLHRNLCTGGLLVVCGGPGQGKTTTAAGTVAGRLRAFGGVCVAAEDPPEIPLHGEHGKGLCLQMEVHAEHPLEGTSKNRFRSCFDKLNTNGTG